MVSKVSVVSEAAPEGLQKAHGVQGLRGVGAAPEGLQKAHGVQGVRGVGAAPEGLLKAHGVQGVRGVGGGPRGPPEGPWCPRCQRCRRRLPRASRGPPEGPWCPRCPWCQGRALIRRPGPVPERRRQRARLLQIAAGSGKRPSPAQKRPSALRPPRIMSVPQSPPPPRVSGALRPERERGSPPPGHSDPPPRLGEEEN